MHPYDGPIQSTRDALLAAFAKLLNNLTLPLTRFGLYDFDIDSHLTFPAMQRHFATIRFLDISMIPSDSSWMVQTIMTSCPLLEDFSGDVIRVLDMMEGAPWVCFGLQILRLVFEVDPENRTPGRTKKDQCLFAYRQLSRLSRLRELDYHGRNSTLEDWHNEERLSSILIQSSRHNRDLCFEPHIQGVHVYSHHYWHSDYPRPEDFEQK
ncbi:hypothetical protein BC939DRAFT_451237 [Gamsiella multidivaricata]|uniref:uncharacterized protein n=1 Tax=Gamsiella multidivaricata TaxID=101098 RepID=UPI00221FF152|nr:uncharacterized protein BC939DRAFT_451237 [Gamsiella multidivaricata]KAI7823519.1 hypothetical protein BC939DRAFT_451237 [Gamsiella multidivaricata]